MNNPTITTTMIITLIAIIFYLFYKMKYYKYEYKHISASFYLAKIFIIDSGNDEKWQEYIKTIGENEEKNDKEKITH